MSLNKTQLIDKVAETTGLSKIESQKAVDAVFNSITESLSNGGQVTLLGFGAFSVRDRAARVGRDPRTGGALNIAAARVAGFKAGKALKDAVNAGVKSESVS